MSAKQEEHTFLKNILKVATGGIVAQALVLLTMPFIARLFPPEAFGVAGLFFSITMFFFPLSGLGYYFAIVTAKNKEDAINLLLLDVIIVFLLSCLLMIPVAFFRRQISVMANMPALAHYLWFAPFLVALHGTVEALTSWNVRKKGFSRNAKARICLVGSDKSFVLSAGALGYNLPGGVIFGRIFGYFLSMLYLGFTFYLQFSKNMLRAISWQKIRQLGSEYKKFPLFSTPALLLNRIGTESPVLFLSFFFFPNVVGYYAMAARIARVPMNILGDALTRVFFQKAAESRLNLQENSEMFFRYLLRYSLVPVMALGVVAPGLFSVLFGKNWQDAGIFMQAIIPNFFFTFLSRPISALYYVTGKQGIQFFFEILSLLVGGLALYLGCRLESPICALIFFALSSSSVKCYKVVWILKLTGIPYRRSLSIFFRAIVVLIPFAVILVSLKYLLTDNPIWLLSISFVSVTIYFLLVISRDKSALSFIESRFPWVWRLKKNTMAGFERD